MTEPMSRRAEIDKRVYERYVVHPGQRGAFSNDPQYCLLVKLIRGVFHSVETSLTAEGLGEDVRNRVQYRLLYGEPPEGITPPDFREAQKRLVDRAQTVRRLMSQPLVPRGFGEEI